MRVIAGKAKKCLLSTGNSKKIRPTSDRVKEAIFNIIAPEIPGCQFLDLFAGSGAVGIEALSRGAEKVVFVESDFKAKKILEKNLYKTGFSQGLSRIIFKDVFFALKDISRENWTFDFVFMDPPYNKGDIVFDLIEVVIKKRLLKPGAALIIEHEYNKLDFKGRGIEQVDQRRYGGTAVSIISKSDWSG